MKKQSKQSKQARMLARLKGASFSGTSLKGKPGKNAAWDNMLSKVGITRKA